MTPLGLGLALLALAGALQQGAPAGLTVSLGSRPAAPVAGSSWRADLHVRRAGRPVTGLRPRLVISRAGARHSFPAHAAGRGRYRATVVFAAAGRWSYAAQIGARTYRLGAVNVRAAPVRSVGLADVTVEPSGTPVVADTSGNQILRFTDGRWTRLARVDFPVEVATGPRGLMAVTEGRRVQRLAGVALEPVAGGMQAGFSGDGGPASAALLDTPTSAAQDAAGNLFITELGGRVRRVDAASGTITTFAGGGSGGDGGPATAAQLNQPHGIAVGSDGTVYFCETPAGRIRRVAPDGRISTVARDLALPVDLALGPDGRLYAALFGANLIVRVDVAGGVTTVATATGPDGVAVAADGTVYATERGRPALLRIDAATGAVTRLGG